jgi:hypothetical protein
MDTPRRSTFLAGVGVAVLVLTAVLGPVLAASGGSAAGTDEAAERTLVGVQGVGSYHSGGRVLALENDSLAWSENSSETYFDVTRLENGSVVVGFMQGGYAQCGPYESPCARTGFRIVDPDPEPEIVHEWSFPVRSRANSEVHDVEPLPDGGFVLTDMDAERVLIVRGGEVVWEWRAESRYPPPADPTTVDWLHINDVDRIGDGRFLVSVRNANQLVVLQRGEGVVEVINEDGDEATLNHQHNPQWLGDGAVLVADSENHRVVELHRADNGTWVPVWTLESAQGKRLNWPRDADRLPNGNTLITDTRNARLLEVNESGTVVWRHQFPYLYLPYEADRVPGNERVGGPLYGDDAVAQAANQADAVPVLTPAFRLVSAAAPLPLWFGEWHLLSAVVGIGLLAVGAVVRRRGG